MTVTTVAPLMRARSKANPWGPPGAASQEFVELAAKLDQEAKDNWDHPEWHRQVAADLASSLDYGFTFGPNPWASFVSTEAVGEFDRVTLRERRGLKVFYTARGGQVDESTLRTEKWEVPRDSLAWHISEFEDKMRSGFAAELASIQQLAAARMDVEVNRRIFNLMQAAVPPASPYYSSGSGLTAATLNALIRGAKDAIRPDGVGPVPVTIVGRAAMVDQISDYAGFAPQALEEIRARGFLGTYRGCNVISLQAQQADLADGTLDATVIPANELWVMGGTAGKFVLYGDLRVKTWVEDTVDYYHARGRKDLGGIIHHPEVTRRFVDTSVTP